MRKFFCLILALMLTVAIVPVMAEETLLPTTETEVTEAATETWVEETSEVWVEEVTEAVTEEATEAVWVEPSFPSPVVSEIKVNLYINDAVPEDWAKLLYVDENVYVPAIATARLFEVDVNVIEYYGSAATVLSKDENVGYFFADNFYAILNGTGVDLPTPSYDINGILYIPLDTFTTLFALEYEVKYETDALGICFNLKPVNPNAAKYEETVNSRKIKSDTDYLIWVSKANYSVRLFIKDSKGVWHFDREYPCAIGKSSSPTCEGTFKYYEKIQRWPYAKYYVGPVMRFNGGYALHSTLMKYDNTPYDDRVGVKISAGCVRLHQPDIQYLWDTVPLKSTVYVTAE